MKQPTVKELLEKIERLEARIRQLEASPPTQIHNHYHQLPVYVPPLPTTVPAWPNLPYIITCGASQ